MQTERWRESAEVLVTEAVKNAQGEQLEQLISLTQHFLNIGNRLKWVGP